MTDGAIFYLLSSIIFYPRSPPLLPQLPAQSLDRPLPQSSAAVASTFQTDQATMIARHHTKRFPGRCELLLIAHPPLRLLRLERRAVPCRDARSRDSDRHQPEDAT